MYGNDVTIAGGLKVEFEVIRSTADCFLESSKRVFRLSERGATVGSDRASLHLKFARSDDQRCQIAQDSLLGAALIEACRSNLAGASVCAL